MKDIQTLSADNIRILAAAMVEKAKSGHPGGAMGGADFIQILYSEFLKFDPKDPSWHARDRFFLDPGHMSAMLYGQLSLLEVFSMDELKAFRQWGSPTSGHPEVDVQRMIENTSGPLGQGHVYAVGSAIAERFLAERFGKVVEHKTYAYISDGGIQEEISQGAGRIAGHLGLNNLIMFYDANDIQLSTTVEEVTTEDTAKKYEAWHWNVVTINGNDPAAIREALQQANEEKERPTLIIGKTVMGKGAIDSEGNSFEGKCSTHGQPLSNSGASFADTIKKLGGNPDEPFKVFDEVQKYYQEVAEKKSEAANQYKALENEWAAEHPELASSLQSFFDRKKNTVDWEGIAQADGVATRAASGKVLGYLAENCENMIVASADLADSDKTEAFLKKTTAFKKNDFSGAFLQAGVSELTMAAISVGMGLHGGVIPVCATFFVFSDYMKPVMRVAALMQTPVIFMWTHDSFRVGEDGPTHQPIEQEAQLRLLEQLNNHHGKKSFLALRPADAFEVTESWKMAVESFDRPVGLIFSRQNIPAITTADVRQQDAAETRKGGYVALSIGTKVDLQLVANGSEVSTLSSVAILLNKDFGLNVKVVSVPSEGLFRDQEVSYQEKVIDPTLPTFGLTAGLPVTLAGLVNINNVHGLDHFGYSAPASALDHEFGFTPETVIEWLKPKLAAEGLLETTTV
ncbi:transketolase [Flammeovirga yaeyamensis]|uniref:transketolase n=1 Tax=Flammeovirga yaeyamensis TaxID=367791 RepID=A0AAX1N2A0_9BACT|nr:transketolase [Flammeovirga yaeyamensis]MBB3700711.1 transketolase [Flammeovirga yaeyamensis]NMF37931.1 transketolase [Flammeovirga yaeyamensis]QWG01708.1 transketolase [Flammeovirga yaeyamensis]